MNKMEEFNILIAGVGGQGNMLASQIICRVALNYVQKVSVGETYGAAQRGGSVLSHIRVGRNVYGPLIPQEKGDVIVGFEPLECLRQAIIYLKDGGWVISNSYPIYPVDVMVKRMKYPPLERIKAMIGKITKNIVFFDATNLARKFGDVLSVNMIMLGAFAASLANPFPQEDFMREIEKLPFASKNLHAFKLGCEAKI